MAKANNQRAEDKAGELKQLNRSIFRPVVTWNKVYLLSKSLKAITLTPRTQNEQRKKPRLTNDTQWNASTVNKLYQI
jgi:hypothetical protein